jgi:hypothetical protein
MTKLVQLPHWQQAQIDALKADMDAAWCVFDFAVFQAHDVYGVDEQLHRTALQQLGEQLLARAQVNLDQARQKNPQMVLGDVSENFHVQQATPIQLEPQWVSALLDTTPYTFDKHHYHSFFQSFCDPPYGTLWPQAQRVDKFEKWCRLVGLRLENQPEVIDWVRNPYLTLNDFPGDFAPRCAWTDYFEDGLEWWGVWCFTIWNPKQQTLAAVMASATD